MADAAHIVDFESAGRLGDHMRRLGLEAPPAESDVPGTPSSFLELMNLSSQHRAALQAALGSRAPVSAQGTIRIPGDRTSYAALAAALGESAPGLRTTLLDLLHADACRRWEWRIRGRSLEAGGRAQIMGIVNVTVDSFSDGGRFLDPAAAVRHGERLAEEGADILDVGGESTRPGADPVPEAVQRERVVPVVRALARNTDLPVSVDTTRAPVAAAALEAGARIVNDVSALSDDPEMARVVAAAGAGLVLMHRKGTPRTMQQAPRYEDVLGDVLRDLAAAMDRAVEGGVELRQIVVDPGIGFGKNIDHNLTLLRHLSTFRGLGRPIMVGASRKAFVGSLTGEPVESRLSGSLGAAASAALAGASIVRVHDVRETRQVLQVVDAIAGRAQTEAMQSGGAPA